MNTTPDGSSLPIFILSHARTGSTLLRYVIDAHPDVCCPPELALGRLCHSLAYTLNLTLGNGAGTNTRATVHAAVRAHVDQIMRAHCDTKGKTRWCDKSTNNVDHLDIVADVFPDAQYICLHRNSLDVVHSLMELFRYGYPGRYGQLVAQSPDNIIDAMVDTWVEATERIVDFEERHASQSIRLKYEDLVADPLAASCRIFSFLELPFDAGMLKTVFSTPHDPGPGDFKIQFTSSILPSRIGKGSTIPQRRISSGRLARINALHHLLGYPPVSGEDGPAIEGVIRATPTASARVESRQWG